MKLGILISKRENGIHGTPSYSIPLYFAKDDTDVEEFKSKNSLTKEQYYHEDTIPCGFIEITETVR